MSQGVYVLGGKCPGGKCPGGKCPGGICPWGKCPGGTCPGGLCPRTINNTLSVISRYSRTLIARFTGSRMYSTWSQIKEVGSSSRTRVNLNA